jgi:uncharacterized protein YecE (DUF72 family)
MAKNVKVGTCGFGRAKRPEYIRVLPVVEVQHTFYDPPQIETLEKWRADLSDDFEFTLKAWQLITHESSSPTYRRIKRALTENELIEAGFFKPNETVKAALDLTLECARALNARTILFQCPVRFQPLPENVLNLKRFFSRIDRGDLNLAWEPRGKSWEDEIVKEICDETGVWHCVDPFARRTVTPDRCYYRLHGIPRWRYTYEDDELNELVSLLPDGELSYVFFNNITMKEDALRFQKLVEKAAG